MQDGDTCQVSAARMTPKKGSTNAYIIIIIKIIKIKKNNSFNIFIIIYFKN